MRNNSIEDIERRKKRIESLLTQESVPEIVIVYKHVPSSLKKESLLLQENNMKLWENVP